MGSQAYKQQRECFAMLSEAQPGLDAAILASSAPAALWENTGDYRLIGGGNDRYFFKASDGKVPLDSQVQNLVQAMASFSPPAAGQTTLPTNYASSLSPTIAANWQ